MRHWADGLAVNSNVTDAPVTSSSSGPDVIAVSGATTVHVREAEPVLPAASEADAANVCDPTVRSLLAVLHAVACPSSVQDGVPSVDETEKVAVALVVLVPPAGPPAIDTVGSTVSTVHDLLAGVASRLPDGSRPRT